VTNVPDGTLHTGVTSDAVRRAFERREGLIDGFTRRYGCMRRVLPEFYEDIRDAIQRESNAKHWPRARNCSFCGRSPPEARLGAGPAAFICDGCVDLFARRFAATTPS